MKIIKKWLERRRLKAEEKRIKDQERHQQNVDYEKEKIKNHEKAMFSLPCPFTDSNCRSKCVHFLPGNVFDHYDMMVGYNRVFAIHAKCLLWNKK